MNDEMDKSRLLDLMRVERAFLERALDTLTEDQMTTPTLDGGRSVKDLLAHIADWEQRCIRWIEAGRCGETPELPEPGFTWDEVDRLNEHIYQQNTDRPLADVLVEFKRSYSQIIWLAQAMSDDQLFNQGYFAFLRDPAWEAIASNTYQHYPEHVLQIRQEANALNSEMDKLRLLDLMRVERAFLQRTLDILTEDQMTAPTLDGGWSVKDILAHIVHWEQWAMRMIETARRGETPEPPGTDISEAELEVINSRIYAENKDRPLSEVLADFHRSTDQTAQFAASMTDDELFTPDHLPGLTLLGWQLIAYNSYGHYEEHARQIRTWLNSGLQ